MYVDDNDPSNHSTPGTPPTANTPNLVSGVEHNLVEKAQTGQKAEFRVIEWTPTSCTV